MRIIGGGMTWPRSQRKPDLVKGWEDFSSIPTYIHSLNKYLFMGKGAHRPHHMSSPTFFPMRHAFFTKTFSQW